jgi:PAS domain S-box-containing protein
VPHDERVCPPLGGAGAAAELSVRDESLLETIVSCLNVLLATKGTIHGAINQVLSILCRTIKADRAYVFELHAHPESGELLASQRYEWCLESVEPQVDNPALQNHRIEREFPRWCEILGKGGTINGHVADFPELERQVLAPQDIVSLLVVPIMLENDLWGFIGFDDCCKVREWSRSEELGLRAAATGIGNAILRHRTHEALIAAHAEVEHRMLELRELGRDLDRVKRTEEELRKSEERLRKIVEHMPVMIHAHDEHGNYVFWNRECERVTGFSADEIIGNPGRRKQLFPDEVTCKSVEQMHVSRDEYRNLELEVRCADGSLKTISVSNVSSQVAIPGWHIWETGIDITEMKRAKEQLVESSERVSLAIEYAGMGTWDLDLASGNAVWSENHFRILGYEPEPYGKTDIEIFLSRVHPDDLAMVLTEFEHARKNKAPYSIEHRIVRADTGETRWLMSHGRFLSDFDGQPRRVLGVIFDTTEKKLLEQSLKNMAVELEQRVFERTIELEKANKAKDEFLANMSHEIRTPMSGVIGLTDILLHQDLPEKIHCDLDLIRSSAEAVMTLINDLFDLSRISQGKFEFHPNQFDPRQAVRDALGPFEFQARAKDLEFILAIDESVPPMILCDRERLAQVIKNLVSNAIKFTDQGFVRIDIRAEEKNLDTLLLFVAITDTGIGIPASKRKEIFNAFTQLDPSYSKKYKGMGLGLAISKSLVEGMGGEITVSSTEGRGATFSFFIPCAKATEVHEPVASGIALSDLPPMTILLVEDNAVNRLFLRRALVTAGHKVGEAEDGKHALAKLGEAPFDLVLMDVQMPEMDGVEATRRIRSGKHGRADIPIIALTAYAMKGDREKFLENGMDGYVTKPVDFGELARVIAEVCGVAGQSSN